MKSYCDSKLAINLWTNYLNDQVKKEDSNLEIYCVHPGVIQTELWNQKPLVAAIAPLIGWMLRVRKGFCLLLTILCATRHLHTANLN